jgi:hypothetical protein
MRADCALTSREMVARGYTEDEIKRRTLADDINDAVESEDFEVERARLAKVWSDVYGTEEFGKEFIVCGFAAPFVGVVRKKDMVSGYVLFQHSPRFYFEFTPGPRPRWGDGVEDGLVVIPGLQKGWK